MDNNSSILSSASPSLSYPSASTTMSPASIQQLIETLNKPRYLDIVVNIILFFIGAPANFNVLKLLLKDNFWRQSRHHLLLLNLASADSIVMFVMVPGEVLKLSLNSWRSNNFTCKTFQFLRVFGLYESSFVLVCISIDRYFAVCKPYRYQSADRMVKIMIASSWMISLMASVPQIYVFGVGRHRIVTDFYRCYAYIPIVWIHTSYNISSLTFMFFIPLIVIIICYLRICFETFRRPNFVASRRSASAERGTNSIVEVGVHQKREEMKKIVEGIELHPVFKGGDADADGRRPERRGDEDGDNFDEFTCHRDANNDEEDGSDAEFDDGKIRDAEIEPKDAIQRTPSKEMVIGDAQNECQVSTSSSSPSKLLLLPKEGRSMLTLDTHRKQCPIELRNVSKNVSKNQIDVEIAEIQFEDGIEIESSNIPDANQFDTYQNTSISMDAKNVPLLITIPKDGVQRPEVSSSSGIERPEVSNGVDVRSSRLERRAEDMKRSIMRQTLIIVIAYFICWLPYAFMVLWHQIDEASAYRFPDFLAHFFFTLAVSNSAVNPYIYGRFLRDHP